MDRCSLTSPLSCFRPLFPSTDPPRLTFFFSLFFVLFFFCSLSFHLFLLPASSWHAHCRFYPTVIYRDFSRSRSIKYFGETIPRSLAVFSPKIVFRIFWSTFTIQQFLRLKQNVKWSIDFSPSKRCFIHSWRFSGMCHKIDCTCSCKVIFLWTQPEKWNLRRDHVSIYAVHIERRTDCVPWAKLNTHPLKQSNFFKTEPDDFTFWEIRRFSLLDDMGKNCSKSVIGRNLEEWSKGHFCNFSVWACDENLNNALCRFSHIHAELIDMDRCKNLYTDFRSPKIAKAVTRFSFWAQIKTL